MALTQTGEQLLQRAIAKARFGLYLANAEIDALAAGSFTSVLHLANGNGNSNDWRNANAVIYRPGAATAADYVRYAGDLTPATGVLANDRNWADTTLGAENLYILPGGRRPTEMVNALNSAMRRLYTENQEPFSLAKDAGMQSSATTDYVESDADGGAATTFSKVTTADSENVFPGMIASGRVLNAAVGGYIRQRFSVTPGQRVYLAALARADVGTAKLVAQDVTNAAEIEASSAPEHTGEAWAYMWREVTMPDGCETLEVRLQGEESTADIYWNGLWVYRQGERRIPLTTTWENPSFRIPSLAYARFGENIGTGVEVALSASLQEIEQDAYGFQQVPPAANPYGVQWHSAHFERPVWIQGRRAYSDLTTFTLALSQTTACDPDLAAAAWLDEMGLPNDLGSIAAQHVVKGPARKAQPVIYRSRA